MRKIMLLVLTVTLLGATAFSQTNITKNTNWKVYNYEPAKSQWDINKAQAVSGGGVSFPVQTFLTPTTGSFAIYLLANYSVPMAETMTLTASATWTRGTYETRSTLAVSGCDGTPAYGRIEFQDVAAGAYTSNDYWWYVPNPLDLDNTVTGTLTAPLSDRANWVNVCGQTANITTAYPGPNCVGGTDPAVSPYDGFTYAIQNVKEVGLSFGSACRYASGIALVDSSGTFTMTKFAITAP